MRYIYIYIWLLISFNNKAQVNLVPNYSFEDSIIGQCGYGMDLTSTKNWYKANISGTPDIYSFCFNNSFYPSVSSIPYNCRTYQFPQHENHYAGIFIYDLLTSADSSQIISESMGVKLKIPLKQNFYYYGSMYVNLGNVSNIAINQIGMLFTQNTYTTSSTNFINTIQPQIQWDTTKYFIDTLNWVKIGGCFIAQGGEEYLTIGNFKDGTHLKKTYIGTNFIQGGCGAIPSNIFRNYYNIDNVSLYELPNHTGTQSYTLCAGDSLLLGDTVSLPVRYQWSLNGVVVDTTKNIMVVANEHFGSAQWPFATNNIAAVLQTKHCSTQTQTITITINNYCNYTEPTIPNVFTPNGDGVNDVFEFKVPSLENFSVYNRWGLEILNVASAPLSHQTANEKTVTWDGRTTSGIECSAGVYFYVLEYINPNGELKKKNGYISLIR